MAIDITIDAELFAVDLSGWDRLFAMRRHIEVPMADIESASVQPKRPLIDQVAVRLRGSSIPGRLLSGSYSVWPHARQEKGDRQFWVTYGHDEVLVIETRVARPRRIVLQSEDRRRLAQEIENLAGAI